jgi:hypothetical protein
MWFYLSLYIPVFLKIRGFLCEVFSNIIDMFNQTIISFLSDIYCYCLEF